MGIKKQFMKSKPQCKVTFKLGKKEIGTADTVNLFGSFSDWKAIEMTKLKTGDFSASLTLPSNQTFEYRYLVNGTKWVNDSEADEYCSNGLGDKNSVLKLLN